MKRTTRDVRHLPRVVDLPLTFLPTAVRVTIARKKDETPEEKRARKQAVKAERQARRTEKKATKESFSKEVKRQVQSLTDKEKTKVRKL